VKRDENSLQKDGHFWSGDLKKDKEKTLWQKAVSEDRRLRNRFARVPAVPPSRGKGRGPSRVT